MPTSEGASARPFPSRPPSAGASRRSFGHRRCATLPPMKRDGYWRATKYIVSDERAFVYFIVPKVACSSIKTALLPAFPDMDQGPHFARELESGEFGYRVHGLFDRSKHQVNKQRLLKDLGKGRYRNHFRFTF